MCCRYWSGTELTGGKHPAHVGGKTTLLYQQIICRATLILREPASPLARDGIRARKPLTQRPLAICNGLCLHPKSRLRNDTIEYRCRDCRSAKTGTGKGLRKRGVTVRLQYLRNRCHGLFERRRDIPRLPQSIVIEPAEKHRPDHVARFAPLNES